MRWALVLTRGREQRCCYEVGERKVGGALGKERECGDAEAYKRN